MNKNLRPCKSCGAKIAKDATKCPQCGQQFTNVGTTALALAGWMGIIVGGLCFFGGNQAAGAVLIVVGAGLNIGGEALKRSLTR